MSDEKHFVIIHYSNGKQGLHPSTRFAEKYDYDKAQDIVAKHNSKKTQWNSSTHGIAHSKPESKAHEYVSGDAYYKVKTMTESTEGSFKDLIECVRTFKNKKQDNKET